MRIVPSIAVEVLERIFPQLTEDEVPWTLTVDRGPAIGAALAVLDGVPAELLSRIPDQRARYVAAVGRLRAAMQLWASGAHPGHQPTLGTYDELSRKNPIQFCVSVLRNCPDQAPTEH